METKFYRVYPCGEVQDTSKYRAPYVGEGFENYVIIEANSEAEALKKAGLANARELYLANLREDNLNGQQ